MIPMSTYISRLRANDFGQPILDDYGMDALPERFETDPTTVDCLQRQVMALLDIEAPAKATWEKISAANNASADIIAREWVLAELDMDAPAKTVRHTVTEGAMTPISREPDYYDRDMAWWIGEDGVVGYAVEHYAKAASVLVDHGFKVRQGALPSEFGFVVMPYDDKPWSAGMGRCNHAYTLWTIAEDAVVAK